MTLERTRERKDELKAISARWLHDKDYRGALLQLAISDLHSLKPSENPLLYAVYVGQIGIMRTARVEAGPAAEKSGEAKAPTEQERDKTPKHKTVDGLKARITNLLRRG
jgi:hypothetical protein